jgi:hypothetical protein
MIKIQSRFVCCFYGCGTWSLTLMGEKETFVKDENYYILRCNAV